jgi:hypothetical protein
MVRDALEDKSGGICLATNIYRAALDDGVDLRGMIERRHRFA